HVDMLNADMPVLLPMVKAGTVKALALFAPERSPLLPDLPTTKELGLPSVVMQSWYGVFLPAGTPTTACTARSITTLSRRRARKILRPGRRRSRRWGSPGSSAAFAGVAICF